MSSPEHAHRKLAAELFERYPDEAARILEQASDAEVVDVLEEQLASPAVEALKGLSPDKAAQVIVEMNDKRTRQVVEALDPHKAAALLARMDPPTREKNLAVLDPVLAEDLRSMAEYPPDRAGALMDPRVTAFRTDATVRDVVNRLKGLRRKGLHDLFLIDSNGRLVGSVPLQDVVLASSSDRIADLARMPTPSVQATSTREAVLEELETHKVGSLPVVDFNGLLLGVLRQEQLMLAAKREASADLLTMVGASQEERALSSPWFVVRKRLPWLQVNLVTAFLAASVVGFFEDTIARFTALAVLLPVVAGQSGNTGAQALAVTMRGLALREIRLRHWYRVGGKELIAGGLNGVAVALTTAGGVYIWSQSGGLAFVIGISMVMSMMAAGVAGAMVPMVLTSLRQDPAQSSSIILTTVTDIAGFLSFLGIATLLSDML